MSKVKVMVEQTMITDEVIIHLRVPNSLLMQAKSYVPGFPQVLKAITEHPDLELVAVLFSAIAQFEHDVKKGTIPANKNKTEPMSWQMYPDYVPKKMEYMNSASTQLQALYGAIIHQTPGKKKPITD